MLQYGVVPAIKRAAVLNDNYPLHRAAARGDVALLEELLGRDGLDVDMPSEDGTTPLHAAVAASQREAVRILLNHGADVEGFKKQSSSLQALMVVSC